MCGKFIRSFRVRSGIHGQRNYGEKAGDGMSVSELRFANSSAVNQQNGSWTLHLETLTTSTKIYLLKISEKHTTVAKR